MYAIKSTTTELKWDTMNSGLGYDGILGLGPKDPQKHDYWNSPSWIDKLSRDQFISQPVFAIFIALKFENASSHIKFGGWDRDAVFNKADPVMMDTISKESYGLPFDTVLFSKSAFDAVQLNAYALFDPGMKFIHVPHDDYVNLVDTLNDVIIAKLKEAGLEVDPTWTPCTDNGAGRGGVCMLTNPCSYYKGKLNLDFSLTLYNSGSTSSVKASSKFTI